MSEYPARSILLVSHFYPPAKEVASQRPDALARHLRRLGHEVTVLTTAAYGEREGELESEVVRSWDLQLLQARLRHRRTADAIFDSSSFADQPHLISRLVVPDAHRLAWTGFARPRARRLARHRHFDCVITTSPPESAHLIGASLSRRGIAWVADLRDGWVFESMKDRIWISRAQHRYSERMERRLLRRADVVTTVSPPIAEDLRERLAVEARLVPNGWDPGAPVDEEAARTLLSPERASIVFTGQLGGARRDPAPLIEALGRLAREDPGVAERLELVFAGAFTERERELFATDVSPARIEVLAPVPREVVLGLQSTADAALIVTGPRRQEASMKLSEYIGAGTPVLAVAHPDTAASEIVRRSGAGIAVDPGDLEAIVEALRRVAAGDLPSADEQTRRSWSWPEIAGKMGEAVEAAIGRRARERG
jgi:glycosyltransferase involved in cell wall biosynthesis